MSKELTEKWKAGKLECGLYWVKFRGKIVIAECTVFGDVAAPFEIETKTDFTIKISEVLAPCDYDELQRLESQIKHLKDQNQKDFKRWDRKFGELEAKFNNLYSENKVLKEKLSIAVKALEFYALKRHKTLIKNCEIVKIPEGLFSNYQGYIDGILTIENGNEAQEALAKIKEIK